MIESRVVQCLLRIAEKRGYRVIQNNKLQYPETDFDNKTIAFAKNDLTFFHVVHEVAHVFLGKHKNKRDFHLREALAESIAIKVRQAYGNPITYNDDAYILGHLSAGVITPAAFARHRSRVDEIADIIIAGIRSEYDAYHGITRRSGKP
jgi:hypothetical protein